MLAELIGPQTGEVAAPFESAVARLAVENRKVILTVALVACALSEARSVHAITRIVVITNRCSCPPGCSLLAGMQSNEPSHDQLIRGGN
jgi:hypothetical protein